MTDDGDGGVRAGDGMRGMADRVQAVYGQLGTEDDKQGHRRVLAVVQYLSR